MPLSPARWVAVLGLCAAAMAAPMSPEARQAQLEADMNEEHVRPQVMQMAKTNALQARSVVGTLVIPDAKAGVSEGLPTPAMDPSENDLKGFDMTFKAPTKARDISSPTTSDEYVKKSLGEVAPVAEAQLIPGGGVGGQIPRPKNVELAVAFTPPRSPKPMTKIKAGMPEAGIAPRLGEMALPATDVTAEGDDEDEDEPSVDPIVPIPNPDGKPENPMERIIAKSEDGREEMRPPSLDDGNLDDDCDSPQVGEAEVNTVDGGIVVDMVTVRNNGTLMKPGEEKVVPLEKEDHVFGEDHESVAAGPDELADPSQASPVDETYSESRMINLPPKPIEDKRSKCSRYRNGNDVPDSLRLLDDDCGMPEPKIQCETVGNTTLCVDRIQLAVQPPPQPEQMPPGKAQPFNDIPQAVNVEFADFGASRTVMMLPSQPISRTIETAGDEWFVNDYMVQLARIGGMDFTYNETEGTGQLTTKLRDTPNMRTIVVYLSCVWEKFLPEALMQVKSCEDHLPTLTARVEIPAYGASYTVENVFDYYDIQNVLSQAPIDIKDVMMVSYDSKEYTLEQLNTTMAELNFADGSAFVVYVKEPCPTQSMTPTASPSPRPSPSATTSLIPNCPDCATAAKIRKKVKTRKYGGYDAYRRCMSSRGLRSKPPTPPSVGLPEEVDPQKISYDVDAECESLLDEEDEEVEDEVAGGSNPNLADPLPSISDAVEQGEPSTKVYVVYKGVKVPVLIKRVAKGIDIFDAVERATGHDHFNMEATFKDRIITHYTPLLPFAFKAEDVVYARDLQKVQPGEPPRLIRDEAAEVLAKLNVNMMQEVTSPQQMALLEGQQGKQ